MNCSPQRYLANNRNLFRDASLTASSVLPVENKVDALKRPRDGTAQARLTGTYTGTEEALYEFQIIDTDVEVARVSAPTSSGQGSGRLTEITASGVQQVITLECADAGVEGAAASITIEGARIEALLTGTSGNSIQISVDQSGLIYTGTNFSTVNDLEPGQGSIASPLVGSAFNWDTVQIANGLIPDTAQRIAFADDPATVYLNYKDFVEGEDRYYLIPALARTVPKGTRIQIVTGGRTVAVTNGVDTETTTAALPDGVVTAFDFLNWIRTQSSLLVVKTPVPNDRSPTGLASREFSARTDAHAEASTGSGSSYARGLESVTVDPDAGTQLVTLTCFAVNSNDHPNASLGKTLWDVNSSLLGALGTVQEGVPFAFADLSGVIPRRLPPGFGAPKGRISANYIPTSRTDSESIPPVCFADLFLGPNAVDGTYTFELVNRPSSGDCNCSDMPVPRVSQSCLGNPTEGVGVSTYQDDTNARLSALRLWYKDIVRTLTTPGSSIFSATEAPALINPLDGVAATGFPVVVDDGSAVSSVVDGYDSGTPPEANNWREIRQGRLKSDLSVVTAVVAAQYAQATESLKQTINNFEGCIAQIDPLEPASPAGYREAGMEAWDDAVTELQNDVETAINADSPPGRILNIASSRYDAALDLALASAGIPVVGKTDASTVSGDGCWRDTGAARYWKCVGSDLMPLFTNVLYYASRPNLEGRVFSAHEFSIIANVKCEDQLKIGDQIQVDISNASFGATYQVGDTIEQSIIAASPLQLSGGVEANPVQTWNVNSSVKGPFPPYAFNPDTPATYSETVDGSTVGFLLVKGGIPAAKGDRFRFAIEGGHYQWRKNGGAWDGTSPPLPIPVAEDIIDEGLSVSFVAGAASSFVVDDLFAFRARQPWAVSNLLTPNARVWKWDPAASPDTATLEADFGEAKPITLFAMLHAIDEGSTVTLSGGLSAPDEWTESITWRADVMWKVIDRTARYVRISITNASNGGSIQWPWIGEPLTTRLSSDFIPSIDYLVSRSSGGQGGRYVGRGISGDIIWTEGALADEDIGWSQEEEDGLREMFDELKRNDDQPFLFIPQVTREADPVIFARLGSDSLRFEDLSGLNRNAGGARRWTVTMPLAAVYR